MLILRSLIIVLGLFAGAVQALETASTSPATLKAYAVTLEQAAAGSQWHQMWKRTRDNGAFIQHGEHPRLTVSQDKLPDMARTTLGSATSVWARNSTQALYRYEFTTPIGSIANLPVKALCLVVDWRTLPAGTRTDDAGAMASVSLFIALPCP